MTGSITVEADGDGARLTAGTLTVDTTTIAVRRGSARQPAAQRGSADRPVPDRDVRGDRSPSTCRRPRCPVRPTDITLVGDLTLHGVTKSVEIPAQAQFADGAVQVAGSLTFPLADFDITAPNVGGFIISIADEGTLEFLVAFEKV